MKKCSICDRKHYARGYCLKHYRNLMDGRQIQASKCSKEGCSKMVHRYIDEKLCSVHYLNKIRIERKISRGSKIHGGKRITKTNGSWKYKNYRLIQKTKKKFCEICGATKKLIIHHLDMNKSNSSHNNLQTLCSKCHNRIHAGY